MNCDRITSDDMDALIVGYFANALSRAQFALLQDALRTNADARRRLAEIAGQDVLLRRILAGQAAIESRDRFDLSPPGGTKAPVKRLRWLPPLALAASLMIAVGLFRFLGADRGPMYAAGRLTHAVGAPVVSETATADATVTSIQTPHGSFCRFDHPDGSIMALDENSKIEWRVAKTDGGKTVELFQGQTYVDLARQKQAFHIELPNNIRSQVVGTRLWVGQHGIHVMDGAVALQHGAPDFLQGTLSAFVGPGQTVTAPPNRAQIYIHHVAIEPQKLAWTRQAGIAADTLQSDLDAFVPWKPRSQLDLSRASIVLGGDWRLQRQGNDMRAHYTNTDQSGAVVFGEHKWLKGELTYKVKLPEIKDKHRDEAPSIGVAFVYPFGGINVNKTYITGARAGIYLLRAVFEMDTPNNRMILHRMETWPAGRRKEVQVVDENVVLDLLNVNVPLKACAPGVYVKGVEAEFFDFRLENAVAAPASALASAYDAP